MGRSFLVACLALALTPTRGAADPPRDHDVTTDDYFTLAAITDLAVSPDGAHVIYVDARWEPPRETRNSDLWLVPATGGGPRRLTFEFGDESSPRWSAGGKHVFYAASRKRDDGRFPPYNDKSQVWRLDLDTLAETPVTRAEAGIQSFAVSNDGRFLYYAVSNDANDDPWKALQERYDHLTYGHGKRTVSELWKLDLSSWRADRIYDGGKFIHEFAVSPDGTKAALVVTDDSELITLEGWSEVAILDVASGKTTDLPDDLWRKEAPSPHGWLTGPAWSADGSKLAFRVSFDGYPTELFVAEWATPNEVPRVWRLGRPEDVEVGEERLAWSGGDLFYIGDWHARSRVYRVRGIAAGRQGDTLVATPGDVVTSAFDVARNTGALAAVKSDPASLEDLFLVTSDRGSSPYRRLTEINPQTRRWKLPRVSLVEWTGADGDRMEGILELPPGNHDTAKLPLVLEIHGGPTAATDYALRFSLYGAGLFATHGYARLSPNYHGSTGYGDNFMTKLIGRENEIEVTDLLTGVDEIVRRGIADPERLAVIGWSNGGFLTNAVIARDSRFKAASSGAGVLDQFVQWGIEDTPGHVINYMGAKLPWQDPEAYRKASPSYRLGQVKTPTLIHVGEKDARVPAAHARILHRALRRYLHVPTHLVVYPGAEHGLEKMEHRRAKIEWDQAWFDHFVLGMPLPAGG